MNERKTKNSLENVMKSFTSQQSAINKVMASFARPSALENVMKSFTSQQSAINKAVASFAQSSALEDVMKSFTSQQSAINRAVASFAQSSALEDVMKSFTSQQSAIDKAMASLMRSSAFETTLKSFGAASAVMFTEPNSFSTLLDSISTIDFSEIEIGEVETNLRETSERFSDVSDQKAFLTVFTDLPSWIRIGLFYFFIYVFLPHFTSISANLLTPIVKSYLDTSEAPERDKINYIKKLPFTLDNVSTDGLRFIIGNNVRLRAEPSTKSVILDEMVLGQVVTILSKKKNWIEVMYEYDSGESLSGWVFNRYTKKFIK